MFMQNLWFETSRGGIISSELMDNNTVIFLKPHHFLDIIKLYGFGLNFFVPDPRYGHNFYKVGNLILKNPQTDIVLTTKADDICKPCKFLKNGKCRDKIKNFICSSKEEWNRTIDKRILNNLNLGKGNSLAAFELCQLASKKLTPKIISKIWRERPKKETKERIKYLLKGLSKYIKKFSA
jgi:hypothetical protein